MSAPALAEPQAWGRRSWWFLVVLIFATQLGLIFWLGDTRPVSPKPGSPAPALYLAADSDMNSELLALREPTLFALPRREGFAGMTWLRLPQQQARPFEWSEAPQWLALAPERLGTGFSGLRETNTVTRWHWPSMPAPEMRLPDENQAIPFPSQSRLRVEGENVELINRPALPSWPAIQSSPTERALLTNSVVQVMVNGAGKPISATLLVRSGSKEADDYAVMFARTAEFNNLGEALEPSAGLRWGRLIFDWHTSPDAPKPATPTPGPAPAP